MMVSHRSVINKVDMVWHRRFFGAPNKARSWSWNKFRIDPDGWLVRISLLYLYCTEWKK